jgi:hypothetical protein
MKTSPNGGGGKELKIPMKRSAEFSILCSLFSLKFHAIL